MPPRGQSKSDNGSVACLLRCCCCCCCCCCVVDCRCRHDFVSKQLWNWFRIYPVFGKKKMAVMSIGVSEQDVHDSCPTRLASAKSSAFRMDLFQCFAIFAPIDKRAFVKLFVIALNRIVAHLRIFFEHAGPFRFILYAVGGT